jgi:phosphoglucosamine mutase
MSRYFGTDGIRGKVGTGAMQPEMLIKLGWAAGMVLKNHQSNEVLIGKDTRVSGYMIESALESGLAAAGVNIGLLGPMPTPAIAYLTATFRCAAGIVISASHNPYYDNGIKFFGRDGKKLSAALEAEIMHYVEQPLTMVSSDMIGKARRISGAPDRYIEFCKSKLLPDLSLKGMTIVVDCANGATYHIAEAVFRELGAETIMLSNQPNGFNINADCGSTHPIHLQKAVRAHHADVGIAYDGDGDRAIMVDHHGDIIDGDALLYILAMHAKQEKNLGKKGIVGTVMTNMGMEQALKQQGIPFARAAVGDKHVMEMLDSKGWFLGGEASGHIVHRQKTISGDGIITSLLVLNACLAQQASIRSLLADYSTYPNQLIAIPCAQPAAVVASEAMQACIRDAEQAIKGQGRVLIRASGTEPKIRVMVESKHSALVEQTMHTIQSAIQDIIDTAT